MKINLNNMKWDGGNGAAGLDVIDAFIKIHRRPAVTPKRSRISKDDNYIFNSKRVSGQGRWKVKQLNN